MSRSAAAVAKDLAAARRAWGLTIEQLAAKTGLSVDEAKAAEVSGEVDVSVQAELAQALGGTFDDLRLGRRFWDAPGIAFKQAGDKPVWLTLRPGLIRAQLAGRRAHELDELLGRSGRWDSRPDEFQYRPVEAHAGHEARELAHRARKALALGDAPVSSMRGVLSSLGIVSVLAEWEDNEGVDAVLLRQRGEAPIVVLNVRARGGKTTALRLSAAHELCHALFDWQPKGSAAFVERYANDLSKAQEQRANAFAAYFLVPPRALKRFLSARGVKNDGDITAQVLRELALHFGMGVEAMAAHLVNCAYWSASEIHRYAGLLSPAFTSVDDREATAPSLGERAVPLELRGDVLDLACQALDRRIISIGRFRELLELWDDQAAQVLLAERGIGREEA